jgi:diguanylate cyclase
MRPLTSSRPPGTPRHSWPSAWLVLLAAIPIMAALYRILPSTADQAALLYPAYGLVALAAVLIAVRRRAPARRRAWQAIAVALGLMSTGDIIFSILALSGATLPDPSVADLCFLSAYAVLGAGILGLVRGRTATGRRTALIDAAIVTMGVAALFWVGIMLPTITAATDPLVIAVSLAYPSIDLLLLLVIAHTLLAGAARPRFLQLLIAGLAIYGVSETIYSLALIDDSYVFGNPVDLGWIVGILLIGVAALHPSAQEDDVPVAATETRLTRSRLVLLAFAALIAPAFVLFEVTQGNTNAVGGLVTSWTILFGLVLIRLATTVDELGDSLLLRRRLQDDLAYQATHDPLTRLANRTLFEQRLGAALEADASGTALIFLDLDDFKTVNDTLGHPTGDALLQTIGKRLGRDLREGDLAARLGGDEFAVLVQGCRDQATVVAIAERTLGAIRTPVALAGRLMVAHASAGIAFGDEGATVLEMMRDADVAMYRAKMHGKDQVESDLSGPGTQLRGQSAGEGHDVGTSGRRKGRSSPRAHQLPPAAAPV